MLPSVPERERTWEEDALGAEDEPMAREEEVGIGVESAISHHITESRMCHAIRRETNDNRENGDEMSEFGVYFSQIDQADTRPDPRKTGQATTKHETNGALTIIGIPEGCRGMVPRSECRLEASS